MNEIVCNSKQKWNHGECRCECNKLDDWSSCKGDFKQIPTTCCCECNKACKIGKYLDIRNCSCEKHQFGKLVCEDEKHVKMGN